MQNAAPKHPSRAGIHLWERQCSPRSAKLLKFGRGLHPGQTRPFQGCGPEQERPCRATRQSRRSRIADGFAGLKGHFTLRLGAQSRLAVTFKSSAARELAMMVHTLCCLPAAGDADGPISAKTKKLVTVRPTHWRKGQGEHHTA